MASIVFLPTGNDKEKSKYVGTTTSVRVYGGEDMPGVEVYEKRPLHGFYPSPFRRMMILIFSNQGTNFSKWFPIVCAQAL